MSDTIDVTQPTGRKPKNRRRVAIVAVLLAVAVLVAAGRWWTHPTAFTDLGDSYSANPRPLADAAFSTTVIFPKHSGSSETITIHGLDAQFSENSARAEATFWVCHGAAGDTPFLSLYDPERVCSDIEPVKAPMRFEHGVWPESDYVFATLTPTRAGVARLKTVTIDYRRSGKHLFQRGTQTIDVERTLTAR